MANKLPVVTAESLATKGLQVEKYTSDLRGSFEEMEKGQIFGFKDVQRTSLYAVKSAKQNDSFGEKTWEVLGVDKAKRTYFVKRIS
jgi:hypothetical protein